MKSAKPRISVVTPNFPIPEEPYRGRPVYETVRELAALASVKVLCPVATYPAPSSLHPRTYRYYPAPHSDFSLPGVDVEYFKYPVFPYFSRPLNGRICRQNLMPLLRREQPQLILAYWLYPIGYAAVTAAEELGVPAVVVGRGSDVCRIDGIVMRELTRQTLSRASFVITVSEQIRRRSIQLGARPSHTRTVRNGCDLSVFHPVSKAEARARVGIPTDAELILFVGRLVPLKGIRELLSAFEPLAAQRKSLHLVLTGEGCLETEIHQLIERTGFRSRVHLLKPCGPAEVAQWINASNLVCLPSHSEGCPNSIIESLACGRPVVATDVGGIPELIDHSNGILVPPGNAEALASAIRAVLDRPWDSSAISDACHRTWNEVAQETLSICEGVLSTGRRSERKVSYETEKAILAASHSHAAPNSF